MKCKDAVLWMKENPDKRLYDHLNNWYKFSAIEGKFVVHEKYDVIHTTDVYDEIEFLKNFEYIKLEE